MTIGTIKSWGVDEFFGRARQQTKLCDKNNL